MNIKFETIELCNFMSFESAIINLNNNGFVIVKGTNNNSSDNAVSNGSGKSAVWEALNWAITGETLRGSKDVVRHSCDTGCYVDLHFYVDNSKFEVLRAKNHSKYKTNLFLYKDDENISGKGIRDTEILLSQYLPDLTSNLINSIVILGQGMPLRFTNNSPSGRKDLLEKLSKSDFMIQDLKTRISNRKTFLDELYLKSREDIIKLETEQNIYNKELNEKREAFTNLQSTDIKAVVSEKEGLESDLNELKSRVEGLKNKFSKPIQELLEDSYAEEISLISQKNSSMETNRKTYETVLKNLNSKQHELKSEIILKEKEINRLNSVSDICPTCGQKLPNVTRIDTSELCKEVTSLKLALEEVEFKFNEVSFKKSKEEDAIIENFDQLNAVLTTKKGKLKGALNSLSELELEEKHLSGQIAAKTNIIESHESLVKTTQEIINDLEEKLSSISCRLQELYSSKSDLENKLGIQKQFETYLKRDFRGILLQNCITYINNKAKEHCKKIFNNELVEFSLDGNNISISYLNKEYESLSGGEKQKIDLIVQFAIRDMLCNYLNFNCNLLVLDELTDNLDSVGCKNIIDFISSNLIDVSSVFIISHRSDLEIPYDKILTITKNEQGISNCVLS